MKKILFIILALILASCTPQVTVTLTPTLPPPTATIIIPTPTLHPEFEALQGTIAAGEEFTLSSDGVIDGDDDQIPGLHVATDGTITLIVGGDTVTLASTDLAFDGGELTIKGYELDENGEWVEAESEAMQMTTDVLNKYSIDPETVTVTESDRGTVTVTNNETGKIMLFSNQQEVLYDQDFAVETVAKASCDPTGFVPSASGQMLASNVGQNEYLMKILEELEYRALSGSSLDSVLIDREKQCWGIKNMNNLFYRDADKVPHRLGLIPAGW